MIFFLREALMVYLSGYKESLKALRLRAAKNNRVMDAVLGVKHGVIKRGKSNRRTSADAGNKKPEASEGGLPGS